MRIYPANSSNIAFRRRLTSAEEREMREVNARAKELLGNTGNSVLVVHDACLPQAAARNIGVANILGTESDEFFDFAKTYFGVNTVEVLPQGEFLRKHRSGLVCAYGYSALGLNDSLIDMQTLTTPAWRGILKAQEFAQVVEANNLPNKDSVVNYENLNAPNSVFMKNLRNAFERFQQLDGHDDLRVEFEEYKKENDVWLEPKSVYNALKRQNGGREYDHCGSLLDRELYNPNSTFPGFERARRISQVLDENTDDVEFYKFRQFVAEKHLQEGRENLHQKGMKLFGDMAIKFSQDEIWANPKAFWKDFYIGANDWKAPCLNYDEILDENSPAATLLKRKAGLNARRYDGVRFDASWMYIAPKVFNRANNEQLNPYLGERVLLMLENEIKRVQGDSFDKENLIHEFKAGSDEFVAINGGVPRSEIRGRVSIFESEHLSYSWGTRDFYVKSAELAPNELILGVGDHTAQPLEQLANGYLDSVAEARGFADAAKRDKQAEVLARIFGDSLENMSKPVEFIRAKFADIMATKHNFVFYMDALGRSERFDSQGLNCEVNYRYKISEDYFDKYHKSVQRGHALNLPDVLAMAFEKNGLDKSYQDIYRNLCRFAGILREKDGENIVENLKKNSKNIGWKNIAFIGLGVSAIGALGVFAYEKYKSKNMQK